ncbi:hypothetical protein ACFV46_12695 [Streptomyces sp. NPDC059852]|uniref:hypothetical protein n=1 Tax=Streptomyces sp. NPDC059852 TaxID=3346972 RepID=UPI00365FC46F
MCSDVISFLAGMTGVIAAIATGTLVLFIVATVFAGAGQGIAISAATGACCTAARSPTGRRSSA